ncbi:SLC13 family permease [Halorubrum sp. DTA98]|uniref:SLC13 family permease n=1 Tax=Halorubrum sp. DTA98 TaxID=3402163 RepID=UPI003AB097AF
MFETLSDGVSRPWVAFPLAIATAIATVALLGGDAGAMAGITAACILLWVLTPVPPAYTGILAIGALAAVFSPTLALSGFQSSATWLVGFGLLMGIATRMSGLAELAGRRITARSVPRSASDDTRRVYRRLLLALALAAHALALLVPSSLVRVLLLAPVLVEIGARFESRRARIGLYLGPLFATFYGSAGVLTADLPNIIISGLGASVADHPISWTEWLVHMYPVMGLTRVLLVVAVVYALFRPEPNTSVAIDGVAIGTDTGCDVDGSGDDGSARRMLAFLLVGGGIWVTDFLHGLDPVVGAVVVVALAFLPGVGVVEFDVVGRELDVSVLFFIAAVLALGDGLAATGLSERAATGLLGTVPADVPLAVSLLLVFATTVLLAFSMEGLAVASVLTPVVITYAETAGLPLTPVLMIEALGLSTYFFPYQSAVLIAMLAEGDVETGELIRTTAACSLATVLVLLPLQLAWFTLLY